MLTMEHALQGATALAIHLLLDMCHTSVNCLAEGSMSKLKVCCAHCINSLTLILLVTQTLQQHVVHVAEW